MAQSNSNWMGIALSPQDAIELVSQNKLAIVIAIESSDSFGRLPSLDEAEMRAWIAKKVDMYYDKGVRSFQVSRPLPAQAPVLSQPLFLSLTQSRADHPRVQQ